MRYVALLDFSTAGEAGVSFPDCPGCTAMGRNSLEATANAIEALSEWMEGRDELPAARSIEELRADPEVAELLAAGAGFIYLPLVREAGKMVRANISLDAGVLEAIDEAVGQSGLTRSSFIAAAAREKIGKSY